MWLALNAASEGEGGAGIGSAADRPVSACLPCAPAADGPLDGGLPVRWVPARLSRACEHRQNHCCDKRARGQPAVSTSLTSPRPGCLAPAACYALKHPDRVQHLILMCPAGVGKQPDDWQPPASLQNPWTVRGQLFRCTGQIRWRHRL
jgi:hypothetical protein